MPDQHSLEETERATQERVGRLAVDFPAAHAIMSLYRAANAARSHLTNTVLRPHDLTWTGFLVMWLLWLWRSMETRHVAESVGISKATLTGVTKTLVARGLIDRVPSAVDRRLVSLQLSDKGEELMAELYPEFNRAEAELVAGIPGADITTLTESLRHIVTVAEEHDPTT
ncbi:MarR family winged helix-turn-helix transcriptional regulator [Nocardioides caldifontis]|uniref:MarR family winged helix-turn-helix transcriptional regulator n=1 Tax=Nocardioides caldifontis TaxID=2588938 RepID=UPI0011DFBB69|nr:MarR family transcriptional regulator [Nocardioides caldifontis]